MGVVGYQYVDITEATNCFGHDTSWSIFFRKINAHVLDSTTMLL